MHFIRTSYRNVGQLVIHLGRTVRKAYRRQLRGGHLNASSVDSLALCFLSLMPNNPKANPATTNANTATYRIIVSLPILRST